MLGIGSVGGLGGKEDDEVLFYIFIFFIYLFIIFKYDVKMGVLEFFYKVELKFNLEEYEEK